MTRTSIEKICPFRTKLEQPRARLFCLPFAGGGASVYRGWASLFAAADIEVCPIELPGRGMRFGEPLLTSVEAVCADLRPTIDTLLDLPAAFFGHSMGAFIAFELALAAGSRAAHLFVSAAPSPDVRPRTFIAGLSDDGLQRELRRMGGTPPEVLENAELMELLLPVFRADVTLTEAYHRAVGERVSCPLTVFAGVTDDEAPIGETRGWRAFAESGARARDLPYGHFFLEAARTVLAREIIDDLARVTPVR